MKNHSTKLELWRFPDRPSKRSPRKSIDYSCWNSLQAKTFVVCQLKLAIVLTHDYEKILQFYSYLTEQWTVDIFIVITKLVSNAFKRVIFHSTNERSHWTKDNIFNLNNLNNSILLKSVSYCYCYCSATNGIFRSESRALLKTNNRARPLKNQFHILIDDWWSHHSLVFSSNINYLLTESEVWTGDREYQTETLLYWQRDSEVSAWRLKFHSPVKTENSRLISILLHGIFF